MTLLQKIDDFIHTVADMEYDLTYGNGIDETMRRETGVFFTPVDTGEFFINNLFAGIGDLIASDYKIVEPAAGSGMLFFLLIKKLVSIGQCDVSSIDADLIEIDSVKAIYLEKAIRNFEVVLGIRMPNVRVINSDFLDYKYHGSKPILVIGNPPYAKMPAKSKWRNIYAYFVEGIFNFSPDNSIIALIIPLSFSCASSYLGLRKMVVPHDVRLIHCKSTPDPLFTFGKRLSTNSAKVIRQNFTLMYVTMNSIARMRSSMLLSWHRHERDEVLSSIIDYYDVSDIDYRIGFIKPQSDAILEYLREPANMTLADFLDDGGDYELKTATVLNYYLGIRPANDTGLYHSFRCSNNKNILRLIHILQSDFFFEWYRTMGDGFHASKGFLKSIPITDDILSCIDANLDIIQKLWDNRNDYMKVKVNTTANILSYDFRDDIPPLLHRKNL